MTQRGRVLITGRYGFTGTYVARELESAGWEVWGVGHAEAPEPDARYMSVDLRDADAVATALRVIAPDAVVHLAAVAFVGHADPRAFYDVNVIGTRILLGALARGGYGAEGVVLASSANIYGNIGGAPIREVTAPDPVNDYAVSKVSMEYAARLFRDRLPLTILRPFNYTGVRQNEKFLVPKIVSHFRARADEVELGNLDVARDFSDVRDIARTYRALLEKPGQGVTVNFCSGTPTALADILKLCEDISGHSLTARVNPDFVRADEIKTLCGDPAVLEGFLPREDRIPLRDTIEWMLHAAD